MKNTIALLLLLLSSWTNSSAQVEEVYPFFFRVMDANQQITFLAAPILHRSLETRVIKLDEDEGSKGFLLEPSLDLNFPIIQGKTSGRPFWNTARIGINYGFNTRVVKTNSSPILPPTNRIGISLDKVLFETISGTYWFPWSFRSDIVPLMPLKEENIQLVYFSFLAEHHSNGQNGQILKKDTINGDIFVRNNYVNGDFSTNFLRFNLTYSGLFNRRNLLVTASLGLQLEFGDDNGFLAFFEEQNERYGKTRILSMVQVRFPPIREAHEIRIRLENQFIACGCKEFPYSKKYANSTSLFLEYNPLKLKTLGLMFHFYKGRDYLNIRYDDPVFISHIGITIAMKKYRPLCIPDI